MSQWTERIRTHSVWQRLEALGPIIDQASARAGSGAAEIDGLERVRAVLAHCGKRLAAIDPFLTQIAPLDGINNALTAAANEIQLFVADGEPGHITTANGHADKALTALSGLPSPVPLDDLTIISEAASSYRDALEGFLQQAANSSQQVETEVSGLTAKLAALSDRLNDFEGKLTTNQSELGTLSSEIVAQRTALATLVSDQQAQFTSAQESRTNEFSAAQATRQESFVTTTSEQQVQFQTAQTGRNDTFTATIAEHQSQFGIAQAARQTQYAEASAQRQKQFNEAQSERQENFAAIVTEYTQKLSEQNVEFTRQRELVLKQHQEDLDQLEKQFRDSAQQILDQVTARKEEVEKLVGVIGNLGVTSGYQRTANHARYNQWLWQGITVAALGGLIFVAYAVFAPMAEGKFTWEGFASRVLLSLTVGVLAAYAGSQADKFHQIEKRNRKLALELEAIGPYLAPLPKELQDKFRVDVGERSFGRHDDGVMAGHEKSPATVVDVVDGIAKSNGLKEIVATIAKAVRGT